MRIILPAFGRPATFNGSSFLPRQYHPAPPQDSNHSGNAGQQKRQRWPCNKDCNCHWANAHAGGSTRELHRSNNMVRTSAALEFLVVVLAKCTLPRRAARFPAGALLGTLGRAAVRLGCPGPSQFESPLLLQQLHGRPTDARAQWTPASSAAACSAEVSCSALMPDPHCRARQLLLLPGKIRCEAMPERRRRPQNVKATKPHAPAAASGAWGESCHPAGREGNRQCVCFHVGYLLAVP